MCCAAAGLSVELEELMVEGLLLQVSLPEITQLYHVLLNGLRTHHTNERTSLQDDDPSDCDKLKQCNSQGKSSPQKVCEHACYQIHLIQLYS